MTFLLKKLFGVREKLARRDHGEESQGGGSEMPFLEHLEELRDMLIKVMVTLMVFMIGAFVFRGPLLEMIKRPMEWAELGAIIETPLEKKEWNRVESISQSAIQLSPAVREAFLKRALSEEDEKPILSYVLALPIFNATLHLKEKTDDATLLKRQEFANEALPGAENKEVRAAVLELVTMNPKAKVDRQGNLINMSALRPTEVFTLTLKLALFAGIVTAFPLLLYFIAQFVFPGLTNQEKRALIPALAIGFGLFLIGAVFCYRIVSPRVLLFFHGFGDDLGVTSDWRLGEYVTFVTQLVLIFGLSFELPVVVMTLVKLDLLSYEFMAKNRAYAVLIIVTIGAIITPTPDALTLCLLSGPMIVLYEMCIWMAFFLKRRRARDEAAEEAERAIRKPPSTLPPSTLPVGTVATGSTIHASEPETEAKDIDDEPIYEEGFGPGESDHEDESVDPYGSYDSHNSFYEEEHEDDDESTADASGDSDSESVDGSAGSDKKDGGDDAPPKPLDDD